MNRRKFIKNSSLAAAAPMVINKVAVSPFATKNMLASFNCDTSDRALVVVFLMGGNDGFNTLVPMNQYTKYRNYRPSIYIPENATIDLDSGLADEQKLGLHPVLGSLKSLYDAGNAHIVQGVGYPNANKSHFKSTDLWLSGGDGVGSNSGINSGHFGRFLDSSNPNIVGNPSGLNLDPLGLQLGNSTVSLGYLTTNNQVASANLTDQDPQGLYSVVQDIGTLPHASTPNSDYGREIDYIMNVERNTSIYAQRISSVFSSGSNSASYPNDYFANQLKTVARLIKGGSKTKIFLLHAYGFDTHDDQIQTPGNASVGNHAELLTTVFGGINAFHQDLEQLGIADRVITTTMSEFGRKIIENGGNGTDHGTLAPMMMFGTPIQGGVTGNNLDLDLQDNQGAPSNDQMQFDYRQVFSSFYQDWLGEGDSILNATFGQIYEKVPIISPDYIVPPACYGGAVVPIELFTFKAKQVADNVALVEWVTLSEIDHSHFIVERSQNGIRFEALTRVESEGGKGERAQYEVYDNQPLEGINYYRLKSIDLNGEYSYSQIQSVTFRKKLLRSLLVYPNPAIEEAFIALNSEENVLAVIQLYDIEGHEMLRSNIEIQKGYHKRPLNIGDLPAGVYSLIISDKQGEIGSSKLIVAR